MKYNIGFIGLGLMGLPMATHLAQQNQPLYLWNRSLEKTASLIHLGVQVMPTPKALAQSVDIVCLCLTDEKAVDQVLFGFDGLSQAQKDNLIVVDHSTLSPSTAINFMEKCQAQTMHYIDAPVTGSVPGAIAGTLSVFAGGETTFIDLVTPTLSAYAKKIHHMGPSGMGQATKMCNQVMLHNTICSTFETLNFAKKQGLDPQKFFTALQDSLIDCKAWQIFGGAAIQTSPARLAHLRNVMKDIRYVHETAKNTNTPLLINQIVAQLIQQLIEQGLAEEDIVAVMAYYDKAKIGEGI